jgi:hypothetical protein
MLQKPMGYHAKRDSLDVVALDTEFLDPHERSITQSFIVRKPLERLMFAPAHCKLFGGFDSNPCRYLCLGKHPKLLSRSECLRVSSVPGKRKELWGLIFRQLVGL